MRNPNRRRAASRPAGPPAPAETRVGASARVLDDPTAQGQTAPGPKATGPTDHGSSGTPGGSTDLAGADQGNLEKGARHRDRATRRRRPEAPARNPADVAAAERRAPERKAVQRTDQGQDRNADPRLPDRRGDQDRALRQLVSSRGTQLSPSLALRAREADAPSMAEVAEIEAELELIRRNYVPPGPLASTRKLPPQRRGRRGDR